MSPQNYFIYHISKTAIEYYSGVLLALDMLKSLGYNVDIKVLDVPNDSMCMAIWFYYPR